MNSLRTIDDSLKNENKDLKERCENLVYAMGALKRDVTNLEEEKKSLISKSLVCY